MWFSSLWCLLSDATVPIAYMYVYSLAWGCTRFSQPQSLSQRKEKQKNHNEKKAERKLVTHLRYAPATEFSFYRSKKGRSIDTRWQAGFEEFYLKSFLPPASIGVAGSWVIPQNVDEVAQFVSWVVSAPFFGGLAPTYMTKFVTYSRGARTLLRA